MTEAEIAEFVTRFAAAWAARDGEAFLALWHPDGLLQHAAGRQAGERQRTCPPARGAERGRAGFRLAAAGLDLAR